MRLFLFLLFVLFFSHLSQAQELPLIEIGKQGHWLFDREIDPLKIGRLRHAAKPFYFRAEEGQDWKKIGWNGKRILPYLEQDAEAMTAFNLYRRNRTIAWSSYGVSLVTVLGWSSRATDNVFSNRGDTIVQVMFTEPVAAVLLATSLTTSVLSSVLFIASDRNLFNAVHLYNNNAGYAQRPVQFKMGFDLVSVNNQTAPALGFRATW